MSPENVEVVREVHQAINRRDGETLDFDQQRPALSSVRKRSAKPQKRSRSLVGELGTE